MKELKIRCSLIVAAFMIKIVATHFLQALFTYYYTDRSLADIYRFYDDGLILFKLVETDLFGFIKILLGYYEDNAYHGLLDQMNSWYKPFESGFYNDNRIMIRLNALFDLISNSYYEVNAVLFSSIAFFGLLIIIRLFAPNRQGTAILLSTILPSYLIWTSGGLKEALLLGGMGMFLNGIFARNPRQISALHALVGGLILIVVKVYFMAAFIPVLLARVIGKVLRTSIIMNWLVWGTTVIVGILISRSLGFDLFEEIIHKQMDFISHSRLMNPGSYFEIQVLNAGLWPLIKAIPGSLYNALFRPMPWQVHTPAEYLHFTENLLLVFTLGFGVKGGLVRHQKNLHPMLQLALPVLVLIGLTTPVVGAIMRYRAPLIVILVVLFSSTIKLPGKLRTYD